MTHTEKLRLAQEAVDKHAPMALNGRFRQRYHFMAPSGWLNDPNGCIWHQGTYHLYYQHNPYAAVWSAMHWGHATSTDLLHWRHQPIALAPSEVYDNHPQGGVFSGSIVEDGNDTLYAFYTATANHGTGFVQTQCMALSSDRGISFQKYQDNPVIDQVPEGISPDFRDPRVIRHNGFWYMVLGASLGKGAWQGGEGCACLYCSKDLKKWEYLGIIARSEGKYGTMWECPDLFPLDGKWVLTFSPMFMEDRKAVYLIGDMDFDIPRFTILGDGEIDWGCEYYAAQSMLDGKGRRIMMAWQNGWDWMPWWKDFGPTGQEGWCGCMALPRTVTLDAKNRLISKPVCEIELLRKNSRKIENSKVGAEKISIPCADPVSFELKMEIDLVQTTAQRLHLLLRANKEKYTVVTLDFAAKKLRFDRNNSDDGYSRGIKECDLLLKGRSCIFHLFSDTSSIELFTDEGRTSMSNTIYPLHPNQETYMWAEGGEAFIKTINTWALSL
jgi:beta-fructofuranosidase